MQRFVNSKLNCLHSENRKSCKVQQPYRRLFFTFEIKLIPNFIILNPAGYSYSPYNSQYSEENQQHQPPQQHQTNGNYLPPLLLDALGGGKRPGKLGGPNHHSPNNPQSIFQSSHGQYHMSSAGVLYFSS